MRTILLVDDDDGVRQLLQTALAGAGFDVIAAADTVMAARQLEVNPSIDLCLVDLVMPDTVPDGAAFARSIRNGRPDLPVILMTGYYTAAERAGDAANAVMYKPIDVDKLVTEIERQLGP